jgi:hypothetical protein
MERRSPVYLKEICFPLKIGGGRSMIFSPITETHIHFLIHGTYLLVILPIGIPMHTPMRVHIQATNI